MSVDVGSAITGPAPPDEVADSGIDRLLWRHKQALDGVAEAELRAFSRDDVILVNDRHDRAADQVPLVVKRDRYDRLHIRRVSPALIRVDVIVEIALNREADEIRDRIVQLFREIFVRKRRRRCRDERDE